MKNTKKFLLLSAALGIISCSGGGGSEPDPPKPDPPTPAVKKEIVPTFSVAELIAGDGRFESGDKLGLFVVNYRGATPGSLAASGNYVNNLKFTYSGSWSSDSPAYWKDDGTHADLHAYHPYAAGGTNPLAVPFETAADQSTKQAYHSADLIAGKATNAIPTSSPVYISATHLISGAVIELLPGDGFNATTLDAAITSVKINGVKVKSTVNLATMQVTPQGDPGSIEAWKDGNVFRVYVLPQTVEECDLIIIEADGSEYTVKKGFTFEAGRIHTFSATIDRQPNGIGVDVNSWGDGGSYSGPAE